jgi:RNA polymerase subunit RPABC4/transcription elongation factor Spt4
LESDKYNLEYNFRFVTKGGGKAMSYEVFISYSSKDKVVAETALAKLEANGIKCWIAPRDILPGTEYARAIIGAIRECPIMVFIFSAISNNSQFVMRELDCAVDESMKIIPFRIEDVQASDSIKFYIKGAHWLDAFPELNDEHFDILANVVKRHLEKGEADDRDTVSADLEKTKETKSPGTKAMHIPIAEDLGKKRELNEYEKGLQSIGDLLRRKQWGACIKDCGAIFEKALRFLVQDLIDSMEDKEVRETIMAAQRRIGKDKSSLKSFGLAQLIDLFEEKEVFGELQKKLTSNLHKTKKINWNQVVEWDKALRGTDRIASLDESDAMQMAYWLKVFLYDCELVGRALVVSPIPKEERSLEECPYCKETIKGDWKFCPGCGVALKVTCESCHRVLAPDFRICPYCEAPVRRRGISETDASKRAQEEYRVLCVGSYLDGVINIRERTLLDSKRLELGLTAEQADKIERQCAPENVVEYSRLVEGVLVDGIITEVERAFLKKKAKELNVDSWVAGQIEQALIEIGESTSGDLEKKK